MDSLQHIGIGPHDDSPDAGESDHLSVEDVTSDSASDTASQYGGQIVRGAVLGEVSNGSEENRGEIGDQQAPPDEGATVDLEDTGGRKKHFPGLKNLIVRHVHLPRFAGRTSANRIARDVPSLSQISRGQTHDQEDHSSAVTSFFRHHVLNRSGSAPLPRSRGQRYLNGHQLQKLEMAAKNLALSIYSVADTELFGFDTRDRLTHDFIRQEMLAQSIDWIIQDLGRGAYAPACGPERVAETMSEPKKVMRSLSGLRTTQSMLESTNKIVTGAIREEDPDYRLHVPDTGVGCDDSTFMENYTHEIARKLKFLERLAGDQKRVKKDREDDEQTTRRFRPYSLYSSGGGGMPPVGGGGYGYGYPYGPGPVPGWQPVPQSSGTSGWSGMTMAAAGGAVVSLGTVLAMKGLYELYKGLTESTKA